MCQVKTCLKIYSSLAFVALTLQNVCTLQHRHSKKSNSGGFCLLHLWKLKVRSVSSKRKFTIETRECLCPGSRPSNMTPMSISVVRASIVSRILSTLSKTVSQPRTATTKPETIKHRIHYRMKYLRKLIIYLG